MTDLFSLAGRTALITGGSRGIGRMIAAGFLQSGARVYITARKAEACVAAAKDLSSLGPCTALPHDIATPEGLQALVADITSREPALDILVNNAGAAWGAPFDEFPEAVPTPLSPWGLRLPAETKIDDCAAFMSGLVEVQDEGSQLIALACEPRDGQCVLDLCAGAGGKALALAAAAPGIKILAPDSNRARLAQ